MHCRGLRFSGRRAAVRDEFAISAVGDLAVRGAASSSDTFGSGLRLDGDVEARKCEFGRTNLEQTAPGSRLAGSDHMARSGVVAGCSGCVSNGRGQMRP